MGREQAVTLLFPQLPLTGRQKEFNEVTMSMSRSFVYLSGNLEPLSLNQTIRVFYAIFSTVTPW
jgi:hypothetical protein